MHAKNEYGNGMYSSDLIKDNDKTQLSETTEDTFKQKPE